MSTLSQFYGAAKGVQTAVSTSAWSDLGAETADDGRYYKDFTISSVNTNKSMIFVNGSTANAYGEFRTRFVSGTSVRVSAGAVPLSQCRIYVLEFK